MAEGTTDGNEESRKKKEAESAGAAAGESASASEGGTGASGAPGSTSASGDGGSTASSEAGSTGASSEPGVTVSSEAGSTGAASSEPGATASGGLTAAGDGGTSAVGSSLHESVPGYSFGLPGETTSTASAASPTESKDKEKEAARPDTQAPESGSATAPSPETAPTFPGDTSAPQANEPAGLSESTVKQSSISQQAQSTTASTPDETIPQPKSLMETIQQRHETAQSTNAPAGQGDQYAQMPYGAGQGVSAPQTGYVVSPQVIPAESEMVPIEASLGTGWNVMIGNIGLLLGVSTICGVLVILPNIVDFFIHDIVRHNLFLEICLKVFGALIPLLYHIGRFKVSVRLVRGEPFTSDDFVSANARFFHFLLMLILKGIILIPAFVFFIIPGIYLATRLMFTDYLVIDRKQNAIESISNSWRMTNGATIMLMLFACVCSVIEAAGFLILIVGAIPAKWMTDFARAYVYDRLLQLSERGKFPPVPPAVTMQQTPDL